MKCWSFHETRYNCYFMSEPQFRKQYLQVKPTNKESPKCRPDIRYYTTLNA